MKYDIKPKTKKIKNKNNYRNKVQKLNTIDLDKLIEYKVNVFLDYHDKNNNNNQNYTFMEKDMKISLDSSIISLFGNINACKVFYSLKEIQKDQPKYILDETKKDEKTMEKNFIMKTKKRYFLKMILSLKIFFLYLFIFSLYLHLNFQIF